MMVIPGLAGKHVQPCPRNKFSSCEHYEDASMKVVAVLLGFVAAMALAVRLVGFTSAAQSQKTLLLAMILAGLLCPICYWLAVRIDRSSSRR
jgi:nucleoside permease NupC